MWERTLENIKQTIRDELRDASGVTNVKIDDVGSDLFVTYHVADGAQSSFEVRDQRSRGLSTQDKYELVNGTLVVPAPDEFDEDNLSEAADEYAGELYEKCGRNVVSPPASAAAPKVNGKRMVSIPHKNSGGDIEEYLQWVTNVAEHLS